MIPNLTDFTWKHVAILKFKMVAVKVYFWRGNDLQNICLLLIWPCTEFRAFTIKCTIFSTYPLHYLSYGPLLMYKFRFR